MNKTDLRLHIRKLKNQFTKSELIEKSINIISQIESHSAFINAKTIMAYWSLNDEVFTHYFLEKWKHQKTILLPTIEGDFLKIKKFEGKEFMTPDNRFGILEPNGDIFNKLEEIDLVIVPGMAFDSTKNRLGRGKGFYDKLLPDLSCLKMGVCFDFQFVNHVPIDKYDVKMDSVIVETHNY